MAMVVAIVVVAAVAVVVVAVVLMVFVVASVPEHAQIWLASDCETVSSYV